MANIFVQRPLKLTCKKVQQFINIYLSATAARRYLSNFFLRWFLIQILFRVYTLWPEFDWQKIALMHLKTSLDHLYQQQEDRLNDCRQSSDRTGYRWLWSIQESKLTMTSAYNVRALRLKKLNEIHPSTTEGQIWLGKREQISLIAVGPAIIQAVLH